MEKIGNKAKFFRICFFSMLLLAIISFLLTYRTGGFLVVLFLLTILMLPIMFFLEKRLLNEVELHHTSIVNVVTIFGEKRINVREIKILEKTNCYEIYLNDKKEIELVKKQHWIKKIIVWSNTHEIPLLWLYKPTRFSEQIVKFQSEYS